MKKVEYVGGDEGVRVDGSALYAHLDKVMAQVNENMKSMYAAMEMVCAVILCDHGMKVHAPTGEFNRDSFKRFDMVVQPGHVLHSSESPVDGKYTPPMGVEVLRFDGKPVAKLENWRVHVVPRYLAKLPSSPIFVEWTEPRDPIRVVTVDGSQFGQAIADANLLGTVIVLGEHDRGHRDDKPHGGLRVTPSEYQLAAMVLRRVGPNLFECQKDRRDDRTWHGRTIRVVPDAARFEMDPRD